MALPCVIYARVSTKEQQDEGYSIPAQLKAIRAFCAEQGLTPLAEFIEAESAGRAGRTRFGQMIAFLQANPECLTVVAHKLDRLYRNFADQIELEEKLGVRARYVVGDVPDTPQGQFMRDIQLSTAKYYLVNLSQEVKKGMEEKVAQGGFPHRAPTGYLNDKNTRSIVLDPFRAPLVTWAFERYETGAVCLADLCAELAGRGLVTKSGKRLQASSLQQILTNPFYCGRIRHNGEMFAGAHTPLISVALFDAVQERLAGNRNGTKSRKPEYPLRGAMRCKECGCLITAGTHKGHIYYRCTHGKGKGSCSQSSYIAQNVLMAEIGALLGRIEIGPEVLEALVTDCETYLDEKAAELNSSHSESSREIDTLKAKEKRLLDAFLEGAVPQEVYSERASDLATTRRALELTVSEGSTGALRSIQEVRDLASQASSARVAFQEAPAARKREELQKVLCNLDVEEGHIASYQWKGPFELLEMESSGAFLHSWWAM